jgi:hypothetical protein
MGCFTGDHLDYQNMVCIDYAGALSKLGEPDPIDLFIEKFMKEEVEF